MKNRSLPRQAVSSTAHKPKRRWKFVLPVLCLVIGVATGWLVAAVNLRDDDRDAEAASERIFRCSPGPWGNLECIRISVEVPPGLIQVRDFDRPVEWFFKDFSRSEVMNLFAESGVPKDQLRQLNEDWRWNKRPDGCSLAPSFDFIVNLTPESRRLIYAVLAKFPENSAYCTDFMFPGQRLDEVVENSNLPDEAIALFKKLVYPEGELLAFNDASLILSTLPDDELKLRFLKAISRRATFLMKLRITEETDIEGLASYWGVGRRAKDLRPLLESLRRVPGGCSIDVAHLIPFFARKRVYTYPMENDPAALRENCHWTALNFFNDPPQNSLLDPAGVERELKTNYRKVAGSPQMGDVVLFRDPRGEIVHSAVYIAEDVLFTKNGEGIYQPWIFMKAADVKALYSSLHGKVSATLYRRHDLQL